MDARRALAEDHRLPDAANAPFRRGTDELMLVVPARVEPVLAGSPGGTDAVDPVGRSAVGAVTVDLDLMIGADVQRLQATKSTAPRLDVGSRR